jgi:hypothetical protein
MRNAQIIDSHASLTAGSIVYDSWSRNEMPTVALAHPPGYLMVEEADPPGHTTCRWHATEEEVFAAIREATKTWGEPADVLLRELWAQMEDPLHLSRDFAEEGTGTLVYGITKTPEGLPRWWSIEERS